MAVSVTNVSGSTAQTSGRNEDVWGARRIGLYRVTLDSSYTSGGEAFDPRSYGFDRPVAAVFITPQKVTATIDYVFTYDYVNKKIFATDAGAESGADDLSTVVLDILVISE